MLISHHNFIGLAKAVQTWLFLVFLFLIPLTVHAYQLTGTVYLGGSPLVGVELTFHDNNNNAIQVSTTDSNGVYSVNLASGTYHLIITPPYQLGLSETLIEDLEITNQDQLYHFVLLPPEVVVKGVVKGNDGRFASGVELAIYNQNTGQNAGYTKTDAGGAYSFAVADGVYNIVAFGYGKNSNVPLPEYWRIDSVISDLQLSQDQTIDISLPNVILSGKVASNDGDSVAAVQVNINKSWTNDGVNYHIHNTDNSFKTDDTGHYELAVLDNASYDVSLYPPLGSGYSNRVATNNQVSSNTTINFTLNNAIYLSGKVLTPNLLPVSGVELQIYDIDSYNFMGATKTTDSGEYLFPLRPGNYKIIATGYGAISNINLPRRWSVAPLADKITLSENRVFDLVLPVVKVAGIITNSSGEPQPGVSLEMISAWESNKVSYTVNFDQGYLASDALGGFSFYTFSHDDYSLTLKPNGSGDYVTTQYTGLNLTQDTERDFSLSGVSKLSGIITTPEGAPVSGVKLVVVDQKTNVEINTVKSGIDGKYEFTLAPGLYKLIASGYASESNVPMPQIWQIKPVLKDLNVNGILEKNIVLPLVKVTGRVFDPAGNPLAGVQLEINNAWAGLNAEVYSLNNSRGFVTTDNNGYYTANLFAYDNYQVELTPPDGSDLLTEVMGGFNTEENSSHDFIFIPTVILEGFVKDSSGRPVDGANLDFISKSYNKTTNRVQSNQQGFYRVALREDSYDINIGESNTASNLPLPNQWYIAPIITGYRLATDSTLNINLPIANLTGRAIDSNGVPVAGVQLLINKIWKQADSYYSVYAYGDKFKTNAQGEYALALFPYPYYSEQIIPPQNSGFVPAQIDVFRLLQDSRQDIILSLPDTTAPLILSGPIVTQITDSTALVQWQTNEVTSGRVEYGLDSVLGKVTWDSGFKRMHNVVLSSLAPATKYYLNVTADDYIGNGPVNSGQISFQTLALPDTQAPLILEGPSISAITSDSALIRWTTSEPTLSTVYYGATIADSPSQEDLSGQVAIQKAEIDHELVLDGLQANTAYTIQVEVVDLSDNGPTQSPLTSFFTLPIPDSTAPMIIAGPMVIDVTSSGATVVWETDEPTTSGVSYNDGTVHGLINDSELSTYHSVALSQLKQGTVYNFTVSSTDALGNGPTLSAQDEFTTTAVSDNLPPVLLDGPTVVNITHQSAVIRWSTDESADSVIEYGVNTDDLSQTQARSALVNNHNIPIVGLQADTTYYFRVLSHDTASNEMVSDTYSFTTTATQNCHKPNISSAPTIIQFSDTTATVYWETDVAANTVVEYETDGKHIRKESSSNSEHHQITLTGLTPHSKYKLHITSRDSECGEDEGADDIEFETSEDSDTHAPQAHGGIEVHVVDDNTVEICWNTDEISDSKVAYNVKGKALSKTAGNIAQSDNHKVVLTNLVYGETYSLKVYSMDINGNQYESDLLQINTRDSSSNNTSNNSSSAGGGGAYGPLLLLMQLFIYLIMFRSRSKKY